MIRLVLFLAAAAIAATAGTPDNVLVVVNAKSALSKNIGEYYARRRGIPAAQICRISGTDAETVERAVYDREIEPAVARCLTAGRLTERILYIVTTQGVPLRISGSGGHGGDASAVDSELTLLYAKRKGQKFPTAGVVPNPFFGKTDAVFSHPAFPMYLVTRLAAYDFPAVKALIDRALQARNTGKFVLDATADASPGNEWLRDAAIRLPTPRTIFDDTEKLLTGIDGVIAYAAWGSNDKKQTRRRPGLRWLPGAIATEFVSTDARTFQRPPNTWTAVSGDWNDRSRWFAGSPQSLTADYLDEGATGASGHVWEPYLAFTPRPDKVLPAYYSGRNLAESFYLGIPALSWQNIVVGDPLCSLGKPRD